MGTTAVPPPNPLTAVPVGTAPPPSPDAINVGGAAVAAIAAAVTTGEPERTEWAHSGMARRWSEFALPPLPPPALGVGISSFSDNTRVEKHAA